MQQIGKYKVIRELGAGGFGAVYLAEDPRLGVQLAIKVFQVRDENLAGQVTSASQDAGQVLKQRFLAEAKTLHQLSGAQHIVQIRDYDEMDDGTPYYVMPYLPRSLVDEIGKDAFTRGKLEETPKHQYPKKLASGRALLLLEQILTGLAAVHQAGLVHRDIKPANILLDSQNNVQICDFGIAKLPDTEHSQSGVGMGSRNYMSPEQRDSAKHVSAASDVYSVGVVAYRMLTGQLPDIPFQPVSAYAPEVGEPLSKLITQALAQQEMQRPPDAGAFLQQFMQAMQAVKSAGQSTADDDATGTWVEQGSTQIKSELKPLQDRILKLLEQQGEITAKDMPVLQALADIGNLNEEDLQQLISHSQQQLANDNAQFKALHGWVNAINKQTEQGPLTQDKQQALIEAGIASTGKDKEELTALIATRQSKTASAKAKTATEEPPKQNSSKAEAPEKQTASAKSVSEKTPEPKKSKAPLFAAVIVVVLSIGGYFGYETYQKSQEALRQQSIAARNEQSAWQQAQQVNTIDGYNLYLKNWPKGGHSTQANRLRGELEDKAAQLAKAKLEEEQQQAAKLAKAKLSAEQQQAEQVKLAQQLLIQLGYKIAGSGTLDTRTQKAIEAFEKEQKLLVTGQVDGVLITNLKQAFRDRDSSQWQLAKKIDTSQAYQAYLDVMPQGLYIKAAETEKVNALDKEKQAANMAKSKQQDEQAWNAAQRANSIASYKSYLSNQVSGQYRQQAQSAIDNIELENSKVALTITTEPSDASIQILNIDSKYQNGIQLLPGEYQLILSKSGYISQTQTINLNKQQAQYRYALMPAFPEAIQTLVNGMVSIPAGSFMMGSNNDSYEKPIHRVSISAFKMMESEVTFAMWDQCVKEKGCSYKPDDEGWGRGSRPVINVSYEDITDQFIPWLNKTTSQTFRLPSEAEWEYAARAGSTTNYSWGDSINCSQARYGNAMRGDCGNDRKTVPVKSYLANAFGIYDMHGNVWEWTVDCWNSSYKNAPVDGSAWLSGGCSRRVLRGGYWLNIPNQLRSAFRYFNSAGQRLDPNGFRLAQD